MRARNVPYFVVLALPLGCGNGVGRPIVERESTEPASSGAGGLSAAGAASQGAERGLGGRDPLDGGGDGRDGKMWGSEPWDGGPSRVSCAETDGWPDELAYSEFALYDVVNSLRTRGFVCETGGMGEAIAPLVMKPELQCVARVHARDMAERGALDHVNSEGVGPEDRIRRTGYAFRFASEVIVKDDSANVPLPVDSLNSLLAAGGSDCRNLVDSDFDSVGIGHFADFWAIELTAP